MRRKLLIIALVLASLATVLSPTAAGAIGETDQSSDRIAVDRPILRCRGNVTDDGAPTVRCRWRTTEHPDAAGYKIIRRGGMEGRTVVFRTRDLDINRFVDRSVEFKTRYWYRVVVVDSNGERLQSSRWNRAWVADRDLERLHMKCAANAATDPAESDIAADKTVTCTWESATSEKATQYELWRYVRGADHRELVATTGLDRTTVTDSVPADAKAVVYAVLALDDDGHIVGRSALKRVRFPSPEPTDANRAS